MRRPPTPTSSDIGQAEHPGGPVVYDTAVIARTLDRLIAGRLQDMEMLRTIAIDMNASAENEALHRQLLALARSAREAFEDLQQSREILVQIHKRASGGKVVPAVDATGIPHKTAFATHLSDKLKHLGPSETLSVVLIEIGALQLLANEIGQAVANRVVKRFSAILRRTVKRTDYVARVGTQHFAIIFDNILPETAVSIALRVHGAIEAKLSPSSNSVAGVLSVTMGIAAASGPGSTTDDLMQQAQNAVAQARKEGRPAIYVA
jgi:diguanylate cyclase